MTRYLYTIEPVPDRPDIVWASVPIPIERFQTANFPLKTAAFGAEPITLDGEVAPRHHGAITVLSPVGSYEDSKGLLHLITPLLVSRAIDRISEETAFTRWRRSIKELLHRRPLENALWILRATPEELQSWAETLGRRS
jgi:hypothetical protein